MFFQTSVYPSIIKIVKYLSSWMSKCCTWQIFLNPRWMPQFLLTLRAVNLTRHCGSAARCGQLPGSADGTCALVLCWCAALAGEAQLQARRLTGSVDALEESSFWFLLRKLIPNGGEKHLAARASYVLGSCCTTKPHLQP